MTEINAAGDAPKKGMSPTDTLLDQLNAKMDVACGLLAGSHQEIKDRCDEFEALLNAPERTMASIRRSQVLVRAAAMKSMGLTTSYLTVLSDYMKQLEKGQLEKGQLEKGH